MKDRIVTAAIVTIFILTIAAFLVHGQQDYGPVCREGEVYGADGTQTAIGCQPLYRNGECPVCRRQHPPYPWNDNWSGPRERIVKCLRCSNAFWQKAETNK
jgi:hypothetical protein